jgi:hypothetical protein
MAPLNPVLIDVPMPIRTPRLLIRPKQLGDGAITSAAVIETWEELHKWMRWAEDPSGFTAELMEIRNRQVMASFILRSSALRRVRQRRHTARHCWPLVPIVSWS